MTSKCADTLDKIETDSGSYNESDITPPGTPGSSNMYTTSDVYHSDEDSESDVEPEEGLAAHVPEVSHLLRERLKEVGNCFTLVLI